eukprot:9827160-Alexandrium_andersonii.AAC.1
MRGIDSSPGGPREPVHLERLEGEVPSLVPQGREGRSRALAERGVHGRTPSACCVEAPPEELAALSVLRGSE